MATESSNQQVRHATGATDTPPPYPPGTSSEQIRHDIERTRADLDQTVDTLERRLHPRHLIDDVLDIFRGNSASGSAGDQVRSAGSKVVDKLKQHPMPAALIGAGIAWLMFEDDGRVSRSDYERGKWDVPPYSGSYVDARTGEPYDPSSYGAGGSGDRVAGAGTAAQAPEASGPGMIEKARGMASSTGDKLSGAAGSARDTASDWADSARQVASDARHTARDYSSAASDQMRRGYESSRHYVERGIEEYPLAMGAAAMAVGVLAGLCLPRTRTEDRLMGEQADAVKERAREMGEQALESGKEVARAGADAAASEAQPGGAAEKIKHVVQDVKQAASESARREGLDPTSLKQKGRDVADRASKAARGEAERQQQKREPLP